VKRNLLARIAVVFLMALPMPGSPHQSPVPEDAPKKTSNFSGIVIEVSPGSITVNRKGLGPDSVTNTFSIDGNTRVEGRLRPRAKVTVVYTDGEAGKLAVRIIVR
jgi:hypothetical protein